MKLIKDITQLFLPKRCLHCHTIVNQNSSFLCVDCDLELEQTSFSKMADNPVKKLFWGRVDLVNATSLYFYHKDAPIQTLLKELKYKGLNSFGAYAAETMILELQTSPIFKNIDCVIPVPLHPKKEKQRGYNQIALFGTTLAEYYKVPFFKDGLLRKQNNASQTKQNKDERYNSVQGTFVANNSYSLNKQHVLIVDDVITTGATLISCCEALQKEHPIRISIITIACVI